MPAIYIQCNIHLYTGGNHNFEISACTRSRAGPPLLPMYIAETLINPLFTMSPFVETVRGMDRVIMNLGGGHVSPVLSAICAHGANKEAKWLQPLASVASASLEIRGGRFTCTAPTRWPPLHGKTKSNPTTDVINLWRTISNRARQREIIRVHSNSPGRGKQSPNGKTKGVIRNTPARIRTWENRQGLGNLD